MYLVSNFDDGFVSSVRTSSCASMHQRLAFAVVHQRWQNAEYQSSTKISFWCFQKFVCSGGCGVCCIGVKFGEVKSQHCSGAAKVADVPRIQF